MVTPKTHGAQHLGDVWRTKVRKPAYPVYNTGTGEGLRPFEPGETHAPVDCAGGGIAPVPPVAARPDG